MYEQELYLFVCAYIYIYIYVCVCVHASKNIRGKVDKTEHRQKIKLIFRLYLLRDFIGMLATT